MDKLKEALIIIADLDYCKSNGCGDDENTTAEECRKCVAKVAALALKESVGIIPPDHTPVTPPSCICPICGEPLCAVCRKCHPCIERAHK
jgi:hypothetical protein